VFFFCCWVATQLEKLDASADQLEAGAVTLAARLESVQTPNAVGHGEGLLDMSS
jgi:hypothetical protein